PTGPKLPSQPRPAPPRPHPLHRGRGGAGRTVVSCLLPVGLVTQSSRCSGTRSEFSPWREDARAEECNPVREDRAGPSGMAGEVRLSVRVLALDLERTLIADALS